MRPILVVLFTLAAYAVVGYVTEGHSVTLYSKAVSTRQAVLGQF